VAKARDNYEQALLDPESLAKRNQRVKSDSDSTDEEGVQPPNVIKRTDYRFIEALSECESDSEENEVL